MKKLIVHSFHHHYTRTNIHHAATYVSDATGKRAKDIYLFKEKQSDVVLKVNNNNSSCSKGDDDDTDKSSLSKDCMDRIPCHSSLLRCRSPVLQAMLGGTFVEATSGVVTLPYVTNISAIKVRMIRFKWFLSVL